MHEFSQRAMMASMGRSGEFKEFFRCYSMPMLTGKEKDPTVNYGGKSTPLYNH